MSQPSSGNDLLMSGGGTPWAKFPTIGTTVRGRIVSEPVARQQTDFDTNEPLTWPSGDPKMEIVVKVQTDERDASAPDDDGIRALHIRGHMVKAVREAVKAARAKGLEVGGDIAVTYTADIPNTKGRGKPSKDYSASYSPSMSAANAALMGGGQQVTDAPPAGVDAATWARMAPEQRDVMRALAERGAPAVAAGF